MEPSMLISSTWLSNSEVVSGFIEGAEPLTGA